MMRRALAGLMAAFRVEPTEDMVLAYAAGLADLSIAEIEAATLWGLRNCRFMPTIAELRGAVGRKDDIDAMASDAWQDVERAFCFGCYQTVDFEDRCINAAIRSMGGWVALLDRVGNAEDANFARLEFLKLYKAKRGSGFSESYASPLKGIGESVFNLTPKRIGMIERRPLIAATRSVEHESTGMITQIRKP